MFQRGRRRKSILQDGLSKFVPSHPPAVWSYTHHRYTTRIRFLRPNHRWLAYDVISGVAFGESIGFVKDRKDVRNLIKNFSDVSKFLEILALLPELSWLARNTRLGRKAFMAKPTDKSGVGVVMAVIS